MASRWIVFLLLLPAGPALAQLNNDPENTPPVLPDPPAVVQNVIPPSQVNAGRAVVSPAAGSAAKLQKSASLACDAVNPCAIPTPAAR